MKNVYTVGQVNAYIKNMFTQDYMLRSIVVSGEVSNVKYHGSGHIYFTLKDKSGELSAVMYKWNTPSLRFRLKEGDKVEATGSIDVYEVKGSYQLKATKIELQGAGALYEEYERLKAELSERGMFDEMYKQPIPKYAKRIGVVTAQTGAAIQDILQISRRRNPYVQVILYPAKVQGIGAKESIVAGIKTLESVGVDVIIVGRGGGSIEDLWAFNEECVAQAIFDCSIPIVSAVGHEVDTTIADYVADLRAPTPSAAAELTVFSYEELIDRINELHYLMNNIITGRIAYRRSIVLAKESALNALSPRSKLKLLQLNYDKKVEALRSLMNRKIDTNRNKMLVNIERLKALSPLDRISNGYAFVTDDSHKKLTDIRKVNVGDNIHLSMRDGDVDATVNNIIINKR